MAHYAASGLILLAAIHYFLNGGIAQSMRNNTANREAGASTLTDTGLSALVAIMFAFFAGTAVLILIPGMPIWVEAVMSVFWLVIAMADAIRSRGKSSGAYFGLAVGGLVLIGCYL
jgi:hypothetical protein